MKFLYLSELSTIKTLPLVIKKITDDNYIIGSESNYFETTEYGLLAIELLNNGNSIHEVQIILSKKLNISISIKTLIRTLYDSDLIETINGKLLKMAKIEKNENKIISRKISYIIFSKKAYFFYVLLFLFAVIATVYNDNIISFKNYISFVYSLEETIVTFIIAWALVLKHEYFHYLAALSKGVNSKIKFSTRYFFVVLETNVSDCYLIDINKRYIIYFAGIISDIIAISLAIIMKSLGVFDISKLYLDAIIIFSVFGILFQLNILLKTDIYFVITDFFKWKNLYLESDQFLKLMFNPSSIIDNNQPTRVVIFSILRIINYAVLSTLFISSMYIFTVISLYQEIFSEIQLKATPIMIFSLIAYVLMFVIIKFNSLKLNKPKLIFI